ncbi:hypothetical protein AVEN_207364-1 [Araneus ventricosus]|uniref:Uncharacterized protein n=1 Tax=Araneus ventricosus TaxID=182803 RepID=A0A4Y2HXL7_ARAVE|nr:hypothetical protein AVEN_207364-1 [Araneus ventricosus]
MSSRMQRFYLQLQCYNYGIFYKPGKEMFVSDTLSRAPLIKNHFPTEEDSLVLSIVDSLPISDIKVQEISDANKSDLLVQELKSLLECGWDNSKRGSLSAKKYLQYKDELHFVDDLLLKLDLIVVPENMRREILNRLHEGHFGIVKTISSEEYSTSDTIPQSKPAVRPQEPVDEPASDPSLTKNLVLTSLFPEVQSRVRIEPNTAEL